MIDDSAEIAGDVSLGPYAVVGADVRIGAGTRLGAHVVIHAGTVVGAGCEVQDGAVLGKPPKLARHSTASRGALAPLVGRRRCRRSAAARSSSRAPRWATA